jgi:hypothetical protein
MWNWLKRAMSKVPEHTISVLVAHGLIQLVDWLSPLITG